MCYVMFLGREVHQIAEFVAASHAARQNVVTLAVADKYPTACAADQAGVVRRVVHGSILLFDVGSLRPYSELIDGILITGERDGMDKRA